MTLLWYGVDNAWEGHQYKCKEPQQSASGGCLQFIEDPSLLLVSLPSTYVHTFFVRQQIPIYHPDKSRLS